MLMLLRLPIAACIAIVKTGQVHWMFLTPQMATPACDKRANFEEAAVLLLKDSRKLPGYYYFSGVPDIPDSKIFAFFVLLRPLLSTLLSPLPSYGVCVVSCVVHFRKCEKLVESSPPPFFFVRFPFYQQCIPG